MKIESIIWLPAVIEKLEIKHDVTVEEVEEIFTGNPIYRKGQKGKRPGENIYYAYGQTETGRYLFTVFINKPDHKALVISARNMTDKERRLYQKSRKE